ncbi:2OG-Fe(II) oxygenase family protein [Brevundimonas sp. 2R-24]|uniref:2OG-Fe(II) oxygenase family protein n=1 Tax=Peiella sedimenti TaxID=3061083 RepID=A0ABT8SHB2_9CAUL|nr:2OG-Fe(II) oxygenase family protein [Caulobacteraceae bacterium XZ-24]
MRLSLNPALDPDAFAEGYARDRAVQVAGIFPEDQAEALHDLLARRTPWKLAWGDEAAGKAMVTSREDLEAMGPEGRRRLMETIYAQAARNIGYVYNVYPMITAYMSGWDPGHPLHAVTEFLQTDEFRDFGRRIIRASRITKTDAQATFYAPGHFLTRHIDDGRIKERRAAYTLSFCKGWEPDWGGLLAFQDADMNIERAYTPQWNTLTLFDGLRMHSVTAVAPFAPTGRYSITGWLRDDPPAGG